MTIQAQLLSAMEKKEVPQDQQVLIARHSKIVSQFQGYFKNPTKAEPVAKDGDLEKAVLSTAMALLSNNKNAEAVTPSSDVKLAPEAAVESSEQLAAVLARVEKLQSKARTVLDETALAADAQPPAASSSYRQATLDPQPDTSASSSAPRSTPVATAALTDRVATAQDKLLLILNTASRAGGESKPELQVASLLAEERGEVGGATLGREEVLERIATMQAKLQPADETH